MTPNSMKISLRKLVNEVNGIIHARNLYSGNNRFINCHVKDGVVLVENLHTGEITPLSGREYRDGHGYPVTFTPTFKIE